MFERTRIEKIAMETGCDNLSAKDRRRFMRTIEKGINALNITTEHWLREYMARLYSGFLKKGEVKPETEERTRKSNGYWKNLDPWQYLCDHPELMYLRNRSELLYADHGFYLLLRDKKFDRENSYLDVLYPSQKKKV